jgi:hypothetical protein
MLRGSGDDPHALLERELELFGVDHCDAGQFLVEQWGLPPAFGPIAGQHHVKPSGETSEWLKASYLACQMADSLGFSVIQRCQAPEFGSLCEMLPPAARHSFQNQAEALKALVDHGISAHDSPVSSPPEPAVPGLSSTSLCQEHCPEPVIDPGELKPPLDAGTPSTRTAWKPIAVAAMVVLLVAVSTAILLLNW